MPSAPVIDVDALLAPIPGDQPAGTSVPFDVREQLEKARKEEDPADYAPDDPRRPEKLVRADWPAIVRLAQIVLTKTSKDLQVSARLLEALVRQHGFTGLRDGLRLLRALIEQCWDRLQPELEDPPDLDVRAAPFNWLDDPDRGARFPNTVRSVPLVTEGSTPFGWHQWRQSESDQAARDTFEKAIRALSWEQCQALAEDLGEARSQLAALVKALDARMGPAAPALTNLREAVEACATLAGQIMQRKGPPPANGQAANGAPAVTTDGSAAPAPASFASTRAEVYHQLAQAAARLQQLEPHSPIPYLVQRAVELGALPFPELIRALIREPSVLSELNRELGIQEPDAEKKSKK
jgi:type VI secretion system protein ImpA